MRFAIGKSASFNALIVCLYLLNINCKHFSMIKYFYKHDVIFSMHNILETLTQAYYPHLMTVTDSKEKCKRIKQDIFLLFMCH